MFDEIHIVCHQERTQAPVNDSLGSQKGHVLKAHLRTHEDRKSFEGTRQGESAMPRGRTDREHPQLPPRGLGGQRLESIVTGLEEAIDT